MSNWFNFNLNKFNNGCCCCNNNNSLSFNFSTPMFGGVFSPTIYGMIHGDYKFYNPTPTLDMYSYYPGTSLFNTPMAPGFSFDSNLFTRMLDATFYNMNQQSFLNPSGMTAPGVTAPYSPYSPSSPRSNSQQNMTDAEKKADNKAKEDFDNLNDKFLQKYIEYLKKHGEEDQANELAEEINKIIEFEVEDYVRDENGEIVQDEEGNDKKEMRAATNAEKLQKLQELYSKLNAEDIKEFLLSPDSGLTTSENGNGTDEDTDSLSVLLDSIGYERDNDTDSLDVQNLKDALGTNDGNIRDALSNVSQSVKLLTLLSTYNTINSSNLMSDIIREYNSPNDANAKKALKDCADNIKEKLIAEAETMLKNKNLSDEYKQQINNSKNKLKNASINGGMDRAFHNLYSLLRKASAELLVNKLAKAFSYLPNSNEIFDFIKRDTDDDLKGELGSYNILPGLKKRGNSMITFKNGRKYQLYNRSGDPNTKVAWFVKDDGQYYETILEKSSNGTIKWKQPYQKSVDEIIKSINKYQVENAKKIINEKLSVGTSNSEWQTINAIVGMEDGYNDKDSGKLDNKQDQLINEDNILEFFELYGKNLNLFEQIQSKNHHGRQQVSKKLIDYTISRLTTIRNQSKGDIKHEINTFINSLNDKIEYKTDGKEIDKKIKEILNYLKEHNLI